MGRGGGRGKIPDSGGGIYGEGDDGELGRHTENMIHLRLMLIISQKKVSAPRMQSVSRPDK